MASSALHPPPIIFGRQLITSCRTQPSTHTKEIAMALVGGLLVLAVLIMAVLYHSLRLRYLHAQQHKTNRPVHTSQTRSNLR